MQTKNGTNFTAKSPNYNPHTPPKRAFDCTWNGGVMDNRDGVYVPREFFANLSQSYAPNNGVTPSVTENNQNPSSEAKPSQSLRAMMGTQFVEH